MSEGTNGLTGIAGENLRVDINQLQRVHRFLNGSLCVVPLFALDRLELV